MADFGDAAESAQEQHLRRSLAGMGVQAKEIEIPPPTFGAAEAAEDAENQEKSR